MNGTSKGTRDMDSQEWNPGAVLICSEEDQWLHRYTRRTDDATDEFHEVSLDSPQTPAQAHRFVMIDPSVPVAQVCTPLAQSKSFANQILRA